MRVLGFRGFRVLGFRRFTALGLRGFRVSGLVVRVSGQWLSMKGLGLRAYVGKYSVLLGFIGRIG